MTGRGARDGRPGDWTEDSTMDAIPRRRLLKATAATAATGAMLFTARPAQAGPPPHGPPPHGPPPGLPHGPPSGLPHRPPRLPDLDRKSTRLNSSHVAISYAVFCLKKITTPQRAPP